MRISPLLPLLVLFAGCGGLSAIGSATPDTGLTAGDDDDDDTGDDDDDDDTLTFGDDDDDDTTITDTGTLVITDTSTPVITDTATTPTDTGTPPTCPPPPDVDITPYQPAYLTSYPDVDRMQVLVQTYIEGGTPEDYTIWDDKLSSYRDVSAVIVFYFLNGNNTVCLALWDFDRVATHVPNSGWAAGMYEAYDLNLQNNQSLTNCEGIDWGGTGNDIDPLDVVTSNITGVAFGPEDTQMTTDFEASYTGPLNFSTDIEPYLYGFYARLGTGNASPTGVAWGNEDSCYRIHDTTGAWLPSAPAPTGGPITQYVDGIPVSGFVPN